MLASTTGNIVGPILAVPALIGIVWWFLRHTREGQWTKGAAGAVKHRLQNGEWADD
jgi:hypothetical protein